MDIVNPLIANELLNLLRPLLLQLKSPIMDPWPKSVVRGLPRSHKDRAILFLPGTMSDEAGNLLLLPLSEMALIHGLQQLDDPINILNEDILAFEHHLGGAALLMLSLLGLLTLIKLYGWTLLKLEFSILRQVLELCFQSQLFGHFHLEPILDLFPFRIILIRAPRLLFLIVYMASEIVSVQSLINIPIKWSRVLEILVVDIGAKCGIHP